MSSKTTGEAISLASAQKLTNDFKTAFPNAIRAFDISAKLVSSLLEQENCSIVRIYNGYDDVKECQTLIMIGVDNNLNEITKGIILDKMKSSPPFPNSSGLLAE